MSFPKEARIVLADVLRILGGEKPKDVPIVTGANAYAFDCRALRRWGISECQVPQGSILYNRQPGFWQLYERYVLVGLSVLLVQTFLIIALLIQRHRRKESQKCLRESEEQLRISEERLRLAQKVACIGSFDWNLQTGVNTWTRELEAIYGLPAGGFGKTQSAFENLPARVKYLPLD